jgi:hypothetical protein
LTTTPIFFIPTATIDSREYNNNGLLAIGSKCLFEEKVNGLKRVPEPPAAIIAFIN